MAPHPEDRQTITLLSSLFGIGDAEAAQLLAWLRSPAGGTWVEERLEALAQEGGTGGVADNSEPQ